jgi:hypothetical protein
MVIGIDICRFEVYHAYPTEICKVIINMNADNTDNTTSSPLQCPEYPLPDMCPPYNYHQDLGTRIKLCLYPIKQAHHKENRR